MRNVAHFLYARLFERQSYTSCDRCEYVYESSLDDCPECQHLTDEQVQNLLKVRTENRYFIMQMSMIISIVLVLLAGLLIVGLG